MFHLTEEDVNWLRQQARNLGLRKMFLEWRDGDDVPTLNVPLAEGEEPPTNARTVVRKID
jgi:hypothetical protein